MIKYFTNFDHWTLRPLDSNIINSAGTFLSPLNYTETEVKNSKCKIEI